MIRPPHNKKTKNIAVIAFVFFFFLATSSALSVWYAQINGYFSELHISYYNTQLCYSVTEKYSDIVFYQYYNAVRVSDQTIQNKNLIKEYEKKFSSENSNFFFTLTDSSGKVVLSNYIDQTYGMNATKQYEYQENAPASYTLYAFVKDPITADDRYVSSLASFNFLYQMRYIFIVSLIFFGMISILLFVYLVRTAGYRKDDETFSLSFWDRIPLDVYIACLIAVFIVVVYAVSLALRYNINVFIEAMASISILLLFSLLFLAICMSFSVRIKVGKWWRNTLIFRILSLLFKALHAVGRFLKNILIAIPVTWKAILGFILFFLINFIISPAAYINGVAFLFLFLFNAAAFVLIIKIALQIHRLKNASNQMAQGHYDKKIEVSSMFTPMKQIGNNLNNISLGMEKAVQEQLKGERLKAELITNVSHDIKTPLTSIVNYVDLLKKEDIQTQPVAEYINVLDRQSARLKKLTEDVLEASKVSTGNISVTPSKLNVVELLSQSLAEYSEKFSQNELTLMTFFPADNLYIFADGRLLWRTFDNLLDNIRKYSHPQTRVYIEVSTEQNQVYITFKNISSHALNISPDELIERFVRGDSARSTEGSGLGLSIAKSLAELQHGTMNTSIDGDLFKVQLIFPLSD